MSFLLGDVVTADLAISEKFGNGDDGYVSTHFVVKDGGDYSSTAGKLILLI
jgi:hypothetical protein